jgi:site-specific DNA-methyltransferase (adenine-specific)
MKTYDFLFHVLKISNSSELLKLSKILNIPKERLLFYNKTNTLPSGVDLDNICTHTGMTLFQLMLNMGIADRNIISAIQNKAGEIFELIKEELSDGQGDRQEIPQLEFETQFGKLYRNDCIDLMKTIEDDSIDLIFADPPFNLNKIYASNIDDNLKESQYLNWCESWAYECVRILKPGGSIFIWNLPKWNTYLSTFLNNFLTFRHWIAVDIKYSLPISNRLYPSHYSLLYYCKGEKPNTFKPDRFPMLVCPHCVNDLKDYGGYKNKMNPEGVNMSDVWYDIPPVRHAKYKKRNGSNELSLKLLDRIIELASVEGDLVFDPFGGSGTTYAVAEIKKRRWLGVELGPLDGIINRLINLKEEADFIKSFRKSYNCLFTNDIRNLREKNGLWTAESVRNKNDEQMSLFSKRKKG